MIEPNLGDVIRTCPHLSESVHRTEQNRGEKNRGEENKRREGLSSPTLSVVSKTCSILQGGLDSLDLNDYGHPWPPIRRSAVVALCSRFDADLCSKAAQEAREIVQAQDRAPNITGLFTKKLEELDKVRSVVRESMGGVS